MKFGVGQSVRRVEDDRLVIGKGRYTDDMSFEGQAHAYMVRSPHAHAKIVAIDTSDAMKAAFAKAAHVTKINLINNRIVVNAMEPRSAIGAYDSTRDHYTLYSGSQGVHVLRNGCDSLAENPHRKAPSRHRRCGRRLRH